jgi:hypothetical protein
MLFDSPANHWHEHLDATLLHMFLLSVSHSEAGIYGVFELSRLKNALLVMAWTFQNTGTSVAARFSTHLVTGLWKTETG